MVRGIVRIAMHRFFLAELPEFNVDLLVHNSAHEVLTTGLVNVTVAASYVFGEPLTGFVHFYCEGAVHTKKPLSKRNVSLYGKLLFHLLGLRFVGHCDHR